MSYQSFEKQVEEILNRIPKDQSEYLRKYLSHAPSWMLESMQFIKKEKDVTFIVEDKPLNNVYILLEGSICAIDYRVRGFAYNYMKFDGVTVLGAMECFFGTDIYRTTLVTTTPCAFLVIPKQVFEKWIWNDKNALQMEVKNMESYLLEQARENRIFLLLNGMDRFVYMFTQSYEKGGKNDRHELHISQQELAERSGFSIRTVNRSVKKLAENDFIGKNGHKIIITQRQYFKMKEHLENILG